MSSLPGLPRLCSLGGGTRDGHFATGEVISRDSARTSRREAPVTKDLLQQLGLNVELATAERGTVTKGVLMREPVECGGWSVMNTVPACYDMINPATNRFRRTGGLTGSALSWPTDEEIEALRGAWFAATDDPRRLRLAAA